MRLEEAAFLFFRLPDDTSKKDTENARPSIQIGYENTFLCSLISKLKINQWCVYRVSTKVFLFVREFFSNLSRDMKPKLAREAWSEEWFKKKLKNLIEERTPLAVAHRLSVLKSSDIG
ncbi:hypothetical protein V1477_001432 [Vespula maculifrons]|uniref:Uncharacterized protein n=1 Tax=Vespula maculifrons TaxID=7453 RepID=A0ABD2D0A7_VESMC